MTEMIGPVVRDKDEKQRLARRLVTQAREAEIDLVGPRGLPTGLTKQVLETALEEKVTDQVNHLPGDRETQRGRNERYGTRSTSVTAEIGPASIDVPRDRDGWFEPKIVRKRRRRLGEVDQLVLPLIVRSMTTGKISAHLTKVYGARVWQRDPRPDHRQGDRGDERVADPSSGPDLPGDLHRRYRRQGP